MLFWVHVLSGKVRWSRSKVSLIALTSTYGQNIYFHVLVFHESASPEAIHQRLSLLDMDSFVVSQSDVVSGLMLLYQVMF